MCGLIGSIGRPEPTDEQLREALQRLQHRGPDAASGRTFLLGDVPCYLGHTRLRIIDLSDKADQPVPNEDGRVWVVYNGEVYNHPELRRRLEMKGHRFRSSADTEVLVHLYEEVGGDVPDMLRQLRGMFAFALLDLDKHRLIMARDRLGIKPLYWTRRSDGLAFSSEIRALVASGLSSGSLNEAAVAEYLTWGVVPGPSTIVQGVAELPPGSYLDYERADLRLVRWWSGYDDARDERFEADSLTEALRHSVDTQLVSDRPVGIFLSSGIDSSAVAKTAAAIAPVKTLTVAYGETDEAAAAGAFASEHGTEHETVHVTGSDVAARIPNIIASMDQPTVDGVNSWIVSRAAHESGLVVALSGLGGDEIFGGYPSFSVVPRLARLQRAIRVVPPALRDRAVRSLSLRSPGGRATRALSGSGSFSGAYRSFRGLFAPQELPFTRPASSDAAKDEDLIDVEPAHAVMLLESDHYLRNQLLRDTDQMSMAHSLEVRVPLLDECLIQSALALPPAELRAPGKRALASAAGIDPAAEKRGFTLPFDEWIRGPLRQFTRDSLLTDDLPFGNLLDGGFRRRLWSAFENGRVHWSRPWAVVVLRHWPMNLGSNLRR